MVYYLDEDVPDRETLSYWIDFHDPPPYEEYDRETWKGGWLKFQKYHDPYLESLSIFLNHKLTHLIDLIVMH